MKKLLVYISFLFLAHFASANQIAINYSKIGNVEIRTLSTGNETTFHKLFIFQKMLNDALKNIPTFRNHLFKIECHHYLDESQIKVGIGKDGEFDSYSDNPEENVIYVEITPIDFELDKLLYLCTNIALDINQAKALQVRSKLNIMQSDTNYVQRLPTTKVDEFLETENKVANEIFKKEYDLPTLKFYYQHRSKRITPTRFYYKNKLFHFYSSRKGKEEVMFKSKTLFQIEDFIEDISLIFISPLELYHTYQFNYAEKETLDIKPIKIPSRNDSLEKDFGFFTMQLDSKLFALISFSYLTGEDYENPEDALLILSKDTIISGFKSKRDSLLNKILPKERLNARTEPNKPIPIILLILFGLSLVILFIKAR